MAEEHANMAGSEALTTQISAALQARHNLSVNLSWLAANLATTRATPPPLPALTSTAHFRLLASDFTTSLSTTDASILLPIDINDPKIKERKLAGNVPLQVLDIEDIGTSKWSQIEAIERVERGEEVRGREVIRTLPAEAGEGPGDNPAPNAASGLGKSSGPHKYLLQDAKGTKAVAFEKVRIPKLGLSDDGVSIGMKVLLKTGTTVRRGVLMLVPENVTILGGRVETWDKSWREGRKERLKRGVEQEREEGGR
jgi:RecQ-mediated genome instability protein 1